MEFSDIRSSWLLTFGFQRLSKWLAANVRFLAQQPRALLEAVANEHDSVGELTRFEEREPLLVLEVLEHRSAAADHHGDVVGATSSTKPAFK